MLNPITNLAIEDGALVVERVQQCTPIADHAAGLRAIGAVGSSEMRFAAEFPMVTVERYCNDRGITWQDWLQDPAHAKAMLNDPALAAFRIWEGRA